MPSNQSAKLHQGDSAQTPSLAAVLWPALMPTISRTTAWSSSHAAIWKAQGSIDQRVGCWEPSETLDWRSLDVSASSTIRGSIESAPAHPPPPNGAHGVSALRNCKYFLLPSGSMMLAKCSDVH